MTDSRSPRGPAATPIPAAPSPRPNPPGNSPEHPRPAAARPAPGTQGARATVSPGRNTLDEPQGGDAYAKLLRDTRGLRREQASAREQWLGRLSGSRREDTLFELEVLLKGLACFGNPRNHPGPPRRTIVAQDYREALILARDAMQRIVSLCRELLGEQDRAFVFQRYLEMVLPDDTARTRLVRGAASQDTPEESLFVLRHALTNLIELCGGVARLPWVPFRLFYAALSMAHREVSHSAFFNPLVALEFRPEFDRITNARLLELMRQVPGEQARTLVALTFLALFRMLRYVALLERFVREPRSGGLVYFVMSVLRSDARALTNHLRRHTGRQLAESFERELFNIPASRLRDRYDELLAEAHRLLSIKATLGCLAANLRLELRRAFERDFPAPDSARDPQQLQAAIAAITGNLRPALQNAVLVLGKALGTRLDEHGVFDDAAARRSLSVRLRRDVWMFAQIIRAFGAKARAAPRREDRWSGPSSLQFVREFLSYFKAMGYPLVRVADYPRFETFLSALSALEESDLLDPQRLDHAVHEAAQFYAFLSHLFEQIGERSELRGIPFDRRQAAEALKLYLGDWRSSEINASADPNRRLL